MPNSKGIITRKDVIEEDALTWGADYEKQVKIAIDSNQKWVKSINDIYDAQQKIRGAQSNSELIKAKQQEALATQKVILGIKEQEAAEISANKIKISAIQLSEAERKAKLAAQDAEDKLQKSKDANRKKTADEIFDQGVLARNSRNQAILNSKLATEYEKLTAKKRIAAIALQNLIIAGKKADETQDQYNARLRVAQHEFDELHRRVVAANRAISVFNDNVGNYPQNAAQGIRDLVEAFGFVIGIDTFVDIAKQAFDIVRNFEAEMVNLAAIAGYTRAEIAPLEKDIREVAKASINSATDVAKLATELIKLGSTPDEVSNLLKPVNDLSIALQATAEDSATLVKSLLNAYQEGSEKAAHYTDVLAESANRSALDFEGLRDSFSYVAPVANTLGISVEKTAALIGTLTDNGIKAESAGRLLATGLGRLSTQGLTLEQALKKITDAQKANKSSMDVLNIANKLFGGEAGKLALILANNTQKIDESTKAYESSSGALAELTEKQLKSINSELEVLSSAWEEYILDNNEAIGGTKAMTSVLSFLSSNLKEIIDLAVLAGSLWLTYKAAVYLAQIQTKLLAWATTLSTAATVENTVAVEANSVATAQAAASTDILIASHAANVAAMNAATASTNKLTAALRANALFLVIAALATVIYFYSKFTKSLEEINDETKKSTSEFLKNKDAAIKNGKSINDLSDRYDELTKKSKLSKDEQKELNQIIKTLSDTVPGAATALDKYGNVIAVNTEKTRDYVKARNEMIRAENALKLEQNIQLLADLRKEQDNLNFRGNKYNLVLMEYGNIMNKNGKLMLQSNSFFKEDSELTKEQLALYARKKFQNEEAIANTIAHINALRGLTDAQKAAIALREKEAKEQAANAPRTIEVIDAEIKALEDSIKLLSDKTGREGNIVKAKIAALNKERDLIYNNNKAQDKDNEKLVRKQLEQQKRVRDAIYNLNQFRLQNAIDINQSIIENERKTIEERISAYTENEQLRQSKNQETLEYELFNNALEGKELEKLTAFKRKLFFKSVNDRIEAITAGKIAVEKLTAAETLLLEKYNAEKKKLDQQALKDKQTIIDSEVDILRKKMDLEMLREDTKLQKALQTENELYNASLSKYSDLEKAQEEHERRILEIKKAYAREGLQVQIKAIEDLLKSQERVPENERLSAEKRADIDNELARLKRKIPI
ncbi:phage tail tape measure protein [Flavobacterium anhuiense]|uniref:phage tail tape measure protein n=1 Tax=Flavobacterium anhuiense TaxID=459526 RepID=UPI0020273AE6|nr:phage tail tape measure protein [Flavobacterium anhuiense]URM37136.1 phage tail tape measure protein [Flavobacterium anhuiense]